MAADHDSLRDLYAAFNARDIDRVLAALAPDVDWPNGMDGTRERGRDAVRAYWLRQWSRIDPWVEPVALADGATAVVVHQVICDLEGAVIADRVLTHAYWFEDGLGTRMEIED